MPVGNTSSQFSTRPNTTPTLQNTWTPHDPRPAPTGPPATPQRSAPTSGLWPSPTREEAWAEVTDPLFPRGPDASSQRLFGPSGPYGSEVNANRPNPSP